jgi:ATP-dependent helicase/nuclease subunit B
VVLPTRRARIYFKNAMAQEATEGIWSPEVSSDDFICRLVKVEVLEPIHLQLDLFDIMQVCGTLHHFFFITVSLISPW